jgi:hypothetical protein
MSDPGTPSTEVDIERAIAREGEALPGSVQDASEQTFEDEVAEAARENLP